MSGIPEPGRPGQWLVDPWPADASFSDVVAHFVKRHPWLNTNTQHLLAYWEGYQLALETAGPDRLLYSGHAKWCQDMRDCVRRCVLVYRRKRAVEMFQANETIPTLPTLARTYRSPALHERAS